MLRTFRIILASVFIVGLTLLFIGIDHHWWGWMAKLQFLPSCLALNTAVIAGILLVTLLFGRIYCSVICPLGVFQDSVNWLSSRRKGKKMRFKFHKEYRALRDLVLFLFLLALMFGVQWFIALIAPYSAYGRMIRTIVDPTSWTAVAVAGGTLAVFFCFAWFAGREWCADICPVGTVLSVLGRFSAFRPVIDKDKCVHCGLCGKKCKTSCIDTFGQKIDYARCVDCFDCISNCSAGAIKYEFAWKRHKKPKETATAGTENAPDLGRRAFIAGAAVLGMEQIAKADGGYADVLPKTNPARSGRLVPPGGCSVKDFYSRCTACGLCISACPNNVLRPSTDLEHLMQPRMEYDKGYCRPECNECSQVCPAGAILPIEPEQKAVIKIGTAKVNPYLCLAFNSEASCGNCEVHCPTGAVRVIDSNGVRTPVVNEELCIGCGACENLCPARPLSAITVDGISTHRING